MARCSISPAASSVPALHHVRQGAGAIMLLCSFFFFNAENKVTANGLYNISCNFIHLTY
jgi:hypothetical protein